MLQYSSKIRYFLTLSLLFVDLRLTWGQHRNIVCATLEAYFDNANSNPNCWLDIDKNATPEQLAANHGLILKKHNVKTIDGYILTTFRLKIKSGSYGNEVIFLQHGLGSDAESFMVNGNNSLAFFLAKQGFDVWLGNYRGSEFSRHESLARTNSKFWDFSFHEHGLYDLSANFKYIYSKTNKKIIYIGHSMGGTGMGIYASMEPTESDIYIKHAILIAPALYMRSTKGFFNYANNVYNLLPYVATINLHVLLETDSVERQIFQRICFLSLENARMCVDLINLVAGKLPKSTAIDKIPRGIKVIKNAALKNVVHYAQLVRSKDFKMFDYGSKENKLKYNSSLPPIYDLSKIVVPVSLIYFSDDAITTKKDIIYTFKKHRKDNWDLYGWPFNHISFVIDKDVNTTFYPSLLKIINKYGVK